jgi:hypothetical protein
MSPEYAVTCVSERTGEFQAVFLMHAEVSGPLWATRIYVQDKPATILLGRRPPLEL